MKYICKVCKKSEDTTRWMEGALRPGLCKTCSFWQEKLDWKKKGIARGVVIVCDGRHYVALPDPPEGTPARMLGHGGHTFTFKNIETGETISSRNVWHQGEIPSVY